MPSRKRKGQSEEDPISQKLTEILQKTTPDKPSFIEGFAITMVRLIEMLPLKKQLELIANFYDILKEEINKNK